MPHSPTPHGEQSWPVWRPARLEAKQLKSAFDWLDDYRKFWEQSFDRLDEYLKRLQANNPEAQALLREKPHPRDKK